MCLLWPCCPHRDILGDFASPLFFTMMAMHCFRFAQVFWSHSWMAYWSSSWISAILASKHGTVSFRMCSLRKLPLSFREFTMTEGASYWKKLLLSWSLNSTSKLCHIPASSNKAQYLWSCVLSFLLNAWISLKNLPTWTYFNQGCTWLSTSTSISLRSNSSSLLLEAFNKVSWD